MNIKKNILKQLKYGVITGLILGLVILIFDTRLAAFSLIHLPVVIVSLIASYMFLIFVHELGHLVCGLLTGYTFSSFRWLSWLIKRDNQGRFVIHRFAVKGTAGQCLMIPPSVKPLPIFWYNFGGVFFNILHALLTFILMLIIESYWFTLLGLTLICVNTLFVLLNWAKLDYLSNDGSNYEAVKNNPLSREAMYYILRINSELSKGARLSSLDLEGLRNLNLPGDDVIQINALQYMYTYELFTRNIEVAQRIMESVLNRTEGYKGIVLNHLRTDYYLLKLIQNDENASTYRTKEVGMILKAGKLNEGVYMIALIEDYKLNQVINQEMYNTFTKICDTSVSPGFALDCRDFVNWVFSDVVV